MHMGDGSVGPLGGSDSEGGMIERELIDWLGRRDDLSGALKQETAVRV
jgi:hypothetical protein